jgi:hypothetical protein
MAKKAAKSLAARNAGRLRTTHIITLVLHAVFLIFSFTIRRSLSLKRYILLSAPALIIEFYLDRLARPTYNADGSLRNAGEDLDAKGLTEFMWDILYWTWFNLFLVIVSGNGAWWLYLVVPLYAIYAAVTTASGIKGMLGGMAGAGGEGSSQNQSQSNRSKKMETRGGQKIKYSR